MLERRWRAPELVLALAAIAASACSGHAGQTSGETHFLATCEGSCGGDYACICGVCTRACAGSKECSASSSTCSDAPACAGGSRACDVAFAGDGDCGALGIGYRCAEGRCRYDATAGKDGGGVDGGGVDGGGVDGSDAIDGAATKDGGVDASDFATCAVPPPSTCNRVLPDVTGCLSGPEGNVANRVYELIAKY